MADNIQNEKATGAKNLPGGRKKLLNWGGQVWRTFFPRNGDRLIDPRYVDEDEYPK